MADLKRFIGNGAHAGQPVKFYLKDVEAGTGRFETVESLRLVVSASVGLPGLKLNGRCDIRMSDLSPSGVCLLVTTVPGEKPREHRSDYVTTGNRLDIYTPLGWIGFQPEGSITWIRTSGGLIWCSARPAAAEVSADPASHAPADAGELGNPVPQEA
jgi:hypothetical protein